MDNALAKQACALLGSTWQLERVSVEQLTPDGSQRKFCRLVHEDGSARVAIAPPENDAVALKEAAAGWTIGRHLLSCGVPVSALFAYDETSGVLVCEDLGNVRLHDVLMSSDSPPDYVETLYTQTVVQLARMQVRACAQFNTSWCWDTAVYDRHIMLERESGYFLRALCHDLLGLQVDLQAVRQEFERLADWASQADIGFFLHRDFQSRNIMVLEGKVRFIDYQAGRLGPLGYDLSSLLIDPYATLPQEMQKRLVERYLDELTALVPYDREQFKNEYLALSLQRNLQILGAFAYLSHRRRKLFFGQYIKPALENLYENLNRLDQGKFPFLRSLVEQCLTEV